MLSLCKQPEKRSTEIENIDENIELLNENQHKQNVVVDIKKLNIKVTQNDEDSDDDLIPYDLSNDVKVSKTVQPAYLRDCLDGLIYSEDVDKVELCMIAVEGLCKNFHHELNEVILYKKFKKLLFLDFYFRFVSN